MSLSTEISQRILEKALVYSCSPAVCPCRVFHTVMIKRWDVYMMGTSSVILNGSIATDDELVNTDYYGTSLLPQRCAHDLPSRCHVRITMSQWTHAVQNASQIILVAARFHAGHGIPLLDATQDFAGVLPHPRCRIQSPNPLLTAVELFSGGFAGWGQVLDELTHVGFPCETKVSLDLDYKCIQILQQSLDLPESCIRGPWCFDVQADELPPHMLLECDLRCYRWLHLSSCTCIDLGTASPPCQPWSRANYGPGLRSDDGTLMLDTFGIFRFVAPRTVGIENVSGLQQHAHYGPIRDFIRFTGYNLKWSQNLNLKDVLPQNRDRLCMIATRRGDLDLNAHICVSWPLQNYPTLYSCSIVMDKSALPEPWQRECEISQTDLDLYLRVDMLPHQTLGVQSQAGKKTKMDVQAYRIRTLQDCFGCLMASYGHAHQLPPKNLQTQGLYGCLLLDEDEIRFLTIPEMLACMGIIRKIWIRGDTTEICHTIGNSIAVPHAAIMLLNMIAFIRDLDREAIHTHFKHFLDIRMNADNIAIYTHQWGWTIARSGDAVPPTIPIHDFVHVVLKFGDDQILIRCQRELDVWTILDAIMGDAKPAKLSISPKSHPKTHVELPQPFYLLSNEHRIDVPTTPKLLLRPGDQPHATNALTPCSVILTMEGIFVFHSANTGSARNTLDIIADQFEHFHGIPCNKLCQPLELDEHPAGHFMIMPTQLGPLEFECISQVSVEKTDGVVTIVAPQTLRDDVIRNLQASGLSQIMKIFGWHFVQTLPDSETDVATTIMMIPRPGAMSLEVTDAKNCLLTLVFMSRLLGKTCIGSEPYVEVNFKLLGVTAWSGLMGTCSSCTFFDFLWKSVCTVFNEQVSLRFLIGGKQVNPNWPIAEYLTAKMIESQSCNIHTVLELRGGGPCELRPGRERSPARPNDIDWGGEVIRPPRQHVDIFYLERHHFEDAITWVIEDWKRLPGQQQALKTTDFLSMQFRIEDNMMMWKDSFETLLKFTKALKETGVELIANKLGWMVTIQFIAWEDPIVAQIIMFPKPAGDTVSLGLIRKFLQLVLFKFALPKSESAGGVSYVFTKVRTTGADLYRAALHPNTRCSDIIDSWDQASNIVALPSSVRMLINGKQSSAEWRIADYARVGPGGDQIANITFVNPLQGGGPSKPEPSSTVRNMLATWLLTQGAEMTQVVEFVNAVAKAGAMALAAVLEIRDKPQRLKALQRLADTLNLQIPAMNMKHQAVKKRVQDRISTDQTLDLAQVQIKPEFFVNEDNTQCQQRPCPSPGEAGISLVRASDASCWYDQTISADEQAMIVIGKCMCPNKTKCFQLHLPAFMAHEPIILDGCLHQLGKKSVKIADTAEPQIPITESAVIAITAFKDEFTHDQWQELQASPVKFCLKQLFQDGDTPALLSPPWGRTFQDMSGRQNRSEAFSFQFHARIAKADLRRSLKVSGKRGIYTIPKTEDHRIMPEYQIIWLQLDCVKMAVAASAQEHSLGIVRNARNATRQTRGIRFHKDDFQDAHKSLKPGEDIPTLISCQVLFKISPVPVGATSQEIQQWLTSNGWQAKPIRSLGANSWLCGAEKQFDAIFAKWNQKPILVKWVEKKANQQTAIVAGIPHKGPRKASSNQPERAELLPLRYDPWQPYEPTTRPPASSAPMPTPIARKLEAPIEDRFSAQQTELDTFRQETNRQIEQLKAGMNEIKADMTTTGSTMASNQKAIQQEIQEVRQETQKQIHDLGNSFDSSLQNALSKQDANIGSQLAELKNLLLNRPTPAKKAKVTKPGDIETVDDENLWLFPIWSHESHHVGPSGLFQLVGIFAIVYLACVVMSDRICSQHLEAMPIRKLHNSICIHQQPIWSHSPTIHLPVGDPYVARLPFCFFAFSFAFRVGEASNPGPTKLAIINPTAVLKKVGELMELRADIYAVSETSATCITQTQVSKSFLDKSFRSFWSLPVSSQFDTIDGRPSFRGEALGTAIFSNVPARLPRFSIPEVLTQSLRFCCCILQVKQREILLVTIYGFPGATRCQNGVRMNDLLLALIWDVIQNVNLPFIVAGDFNEPPTSLPIFRAFRDIGAFEINEWYQNRYGVKLPATCRSSTRNDTAIIHPLLADCLQSVEVCTQKQMGDHSPMLLTFDFGAQTNLGSRWVLPQSWAQFAPSTEDIARNYVALQHKYRHFQITSSQDVTQALEQWSMHVEHAVDLSCKQQHHQDPIAFPWNGLPSRFKGRCQKIQRSFAQPSSVKDDKPGGYTPPCEIFSLMPRLKTRQVRRLMSLMRGLKSVALHDTSRDADLLTEWKRILRAQGYGHSWERWILGFEALPYLPQNVPPIDILDIAIAITKIDCDHACQCEHSNRQKSFRYRMNLDKTLDFSKLTYKLMKDPKNPYINEVPAKHTAQAVLCRAVKGVSILKLQVPHPAFTVDAKAKFSNAIIHVLDQKGAILHFRLVEGVLPTKGILEQDFVACSNQDLFSEFNKFWSPYWLRDSPQDQFLDTQCEDFLTEWDSIPFPHFPKISIQLDDVELWIQAIKNLKKGKAVGSCGWRHEELKLLPRCCIQHLANIFHASQDYAFEDFLMFARTTLLPKCESPSSMNQIRPITIIGALFRLYGKVVFKEVVKTWSNILPWGVMGGLPNKGVKDLALFQKLLIEKSIASKKPLGGFSLDLVKAFNTFGRRMMFHAMTKMGIPSRIVNFWINSLSNLIRFPEIRGRYGEGLASTVGAPEGDCLSVLAMISLSTAFYYRVQDDLLSVRAFAYADNWAWFCENIRAQFRTLIKVLNFVHSLKVTIDFKKSWNWGTTREMKNGHEILQLLFPSEVDTIVTRQHVKDLGEAVSYGKFIPMDFIRTRIELAIARIRRLRRLPIDVQDKCLKIQSSAWPAALYAADTTYVGKKHFQDLRLAVVHALIGTRNFANAWVAVSMVSRFLTDPLLYVLFSMVRLIRRLAHRDMPLALEFIQMSTLFQGRRPYGPASAFSVYCDNVGWTLHDDAVLECTPTLTCNLLHDPLPDILDTLKKAWPYVVVQQVDRKGVGDFIPDSDMLHNVLKIFSDADQQLLLFYVLGSFQVDGIKHKWKHDSTPNCPLCGEVDTRPHRYLSCKALEHIRIQHPDAVNILEQCREEWMYMPLPRLSPDVELCELLHRSPFVQNHPKPFPNNDGPTTFFTDGGGLFPQFPSARVASWAVIQDIAPNVQIRQAAAQKMLCDPGSFPGFQTIALGMVPGKQTVGRGELFALVNAVRSACQLPRHEVVYFVTDAQYVLKIVHRITVSGLAWTSYRTKHLDLIQELYELWDPHRFFIFKVKSHQNPHKISSFPALWNALGNSCADTGATMALKHLPPSIFQLHRDLKLWIVRERNWLIDVFKYVLALNRARIPLVNNLDQVLHEDSPNVIQSDMRMPRGAFGEDAFHILTNFQPSHYVSICTELTIPPLPTLQLFLQGARLALALFEWLRLLYWPPDLNEDYLCEDDWGISWVELFINFVQTTGCHFPIKISGTGYNMKQVAFLSSEGLLLPKSKRSLASQVVCFQRGITALRTLSPGVWFPTFKKNRVTSLKHLGWDIQVTGIPCRPCMPNQDRTMKTFHDLICGPGHKRNLSDNDVLVVHDPMLQIGDAPDLPMDERFRRYSSHMYERRKAANGD